MLRSVSSTASTVPRVGEPGVVDPSEDGTLGRIGKPGMVDPGEDGTLGRIGEPGMVDPGEDEAKNEGGTVAIIGEPGMVDPGEDNISCFTQTFFKTASSSESLLASPGSVRPPDAV